MEVIAVGYGASIAHQRYLLLGEIQEQRVLLASLNRRSENISVLPIIIAELKFGNIERHIFSAHFVERADYAALEDRPEALDGLSMNRANDILAIRMIDDGCG
jgi:hypothetical protein